MSASNELRVFISSTFRDLQEERHHLVKKIFPEIRAICRGRGITFTEVDLRWGLTDEDVALGRVIRTCLDEVDKCRPYFIGITGDRYGFIPSYLDVQKDPQLLEHYPWIEEAAIDGMSITEMEAQYAVLRSDEGGRMKDDAGLARFYFRRHRESPDDVAADNEERVRLEAYQQRIRDSGVHVAEFRDTGSLGELIYDDLINIINRDFADSRPPTPLEQERMRHEAFSLSRRRAYIPNPAYLKRLYDFVKGLETRDAGLAKEPKEQVPSPASNLYPRNPALVVYAESGSGKSSLFAHWAQQFRRKHPDAHLIEHYIGIGATATDHYAVIHHVCMEIKDCFGREEEVPTDPETLETALGQWLGYADHALRGAMPREGGATTHAVERDLTDADLADSSFIPHPSSLIIILDGLNQLQGEALKLRWIPDAIPPSIRLILSSTAEATLVEMRSRGWSQFGIQALTEAERQTIVVRYLAEYHKSLNPEQIARIADDDKCGHPLFLKTVLEELRLVGEYEELDAAIEYYLAATGTEDLFQRVLKRLEEDHTVPAVRDVMSLLGTSRGGLDERELSEISGIARLTIATMITGLEYHLVRKEGHLTFFHDFLRQAVESRYLHDDAKHREVHLRIADFFQQSTSAMIATGRKIPIRTAAELCWHLESAGSIDRLRGCLTTIPLFVTLYVGETAYEVMRYWSSMDAGADVAGMYRRGLSNWRVEEADEWSKGVGLVSALLERLGHWSEAIGLERERLVFALERGQRAEEAASRRSIGWLLCLRGESAEAFEELQRALDISTELDDRHGASVTIGTMGVVYSRRGEYASAMECYERRLRMDEAAGDRVGISAAIGNMGVVYDRRGEYEQAMKCYERQLCIAEELGDRRSISRAIGNMGGVYCIRGEYERAMECYKRLLGIAEELGDRRGVSVAVGNMGLVYDSRGDFERAMECYERQVRIAEEFGDRNGICAAMGNMGGVHTMRGEYQRALECYERQLRIAEESGDRNGVSVAVGNLGLVFLSCGEYARALKNLHRAADESRAIGDRPACVEWLQGIGTILLEGALTDAMPEYLPTHLPNATPVTWRDEALGRARDAAEDCVAISEELSNQDALLAGHVLFARIEAADGAPEHALQRLQSMLDSATGDAQRAELHYWLWKFGEAGHGAYALASYETLYAAVPKFDYQKRIEELNGAEEEA